MKEILNKEKNKLKVLVSLLIVVIVVMIGSYAIFQNFTRQSGTNSLGATACFSVSFEGVNNAINLANDYPIPDREGLERSPYTFKVTNNCNQYLTLSIGIETLSTSEIPAKLIKGVIVKSGDVPVNPIILSKGNVMEAQNNGSAYSLVEDTLKANESKTYDLRLWFDEAMTKEEGASKTYKGKVIVASSASVAPPTFTETILANNEVKVPLTSPSVEISAYTLEDVTTTNTRNVSSTEQKYYVTYGTEWEASGTKFNLTGTVVSADTYANSYSNLVGKYLPYNSISSSGSSTAGTMMTTTDLDSVYYVVSVTSSSFTYKEITSNKNVSEALLASTEDDYGTSYYFRGSVKNNYVEFANKCWRVVRIGGDNTVKLILHNDNTSNVSNPCSSANNSDNAAFIRNDLIWFDLYGGKERNDNAFAGIMYGTPGSNTYEETHANINKSSALTILETWYNNNLKTYESVIDDNVFCNDKNISGSGLGYGTNATEYMAYERLYTNRTPSLKCNGDLSKITSKIGLITADELAFAGYAALSDGTQNFLNENGDTFLSISPSNFYKRIYLWKVSGGVLLCGVKTNLTIGLDKSHLRPYISLISSVKVTGDGTSENPYKVVIKGNN